jgi:hypothetical protein
MCEALLIPAPKKKRQNPKQNKKKPYRCKECFDIKAE